MTATTKLDKGVSDQTYIRREQTKVKAHHLRVALVWTEDTVDDNDAVVEDLTKYGLSTFGGIRGITHTTNNAVLVSEAPTTQVTTGNVTITVGGTTDNKRRSFLIFGGE